MKKFVKLLIQIIIMASLVATNVEAGILDSSPLPKTCLPRVNRMLPIKGSVTASDHSKCHCPPDAFCTTTTTYNGKTTRKLPSYIYNICCDGTVTVNPPPPPPTRIIPKPPIPPKSCEVHYYKSSISRCEDRTFIGTRIAGYCSEYTAQNTNPLYSKVVALNKCLQNKCQGIKTQIASIDKSKGKFLEINTFAREQAEIKPQVRLKDYVTCRRQCFNANNFNDGLNSNTNALMDPLEIQLNEWIMLELNDNVTDFEIMQGKSEQSALIKLLGKTKWGETAGEIARRGSTDTTLKYFTAKIFGPSAHATVNQKKFSLFFDNTYHPNRYPGTYPAGNELKYFTDIANTDKELDSLTYDSSKPGIFDAFDGNTARTYFVKAMESVRPKFQNLETLTIDHRKDYIPQPWSGITCNQETYFGMCITTFSNDGSCDSCLSPTTKITLSDKSVKLIKDLKVGEQIKSAYGQNATIEDIIHINWPELVLYNINDGQLKITADHPIMTKNGWRAINYDARKDDESYKRYGLETVASLEIGDVIITETGETPVTRIMPEAAVKNGETYNLRLKDGSKSFYANGVLVKSHN